MYAEIKARLDKLVTGFETIYGIYQQNYDFFHPEESSFLNDSIFGFFRDLDQMKRYLETIKEGEGDVDGLGWVQYLGYVAIAGTVAALVYTADKNLSRMFDVQEKKLDQAMEVAKLGPERAALYQANLQASPDLSISDLLSQIKPAISPTIPWWLIPAALVGGYFYFRSQR